MLRLALLVLVVRDWWLMLRSLHHTRCHALVWNKSIPVVAELVVLELVHKVLLVCSLHSAWTWVHNFLSYQVLRILSWRQHFDIVAITTLPTKTRHFVMRYFRDMVLLAWSWVLCRFCKLLLFNLPALGQNWVVVCMLDLLFMATSQIFNFGFRWNCRVWNYLSVLLAYCNFVIFRLRLASRYRTLCAWLWLASCCFKWAIQVATIV
jgi:hypothetical protein